MSEKKITARMVAEAICRVSSVAGYAYDRLGADGPPQPLAERVENLLRPRPPYGAYIVDGDPHGWDASGRTPVTIYMEQIGGEGDCMLPLDYYGEETGEDGFEVSAAASALLPGSAYIEFVNAAVAVVVPD